jgi:hypothetical protein
MKANRSIPSSTVIPVLTYPDVGAATDWIVAAFGFRERLRIGEGHRSQLTYGDGAVILPEDSHGRHVPAADEQTHSVTVRVEMPVHTASSYGTPARRSRLNQPIWSSVSDGTTRSTPGVITGPSANPSPIRHPRTGVGRPSTWTKDRNGNGLRA